MSTVTEHGDAVVDPDLLELFDSLFADRGSDRGLEPGALAGGLWSDLEEAGLAKLTGRGEFGSAATWLEAAELLRTAARHGARLPIAEHDLLAGWLAERAGLPDAAHLRTSARANREGMAAGTPWGRHARSGVFLLEDAGSWRVTEAIIDKSTLVPGHNLAGEARDRVTIARSNVSAVAIDASVADEWYLRGALARAIQISGALARATEIAVQYSLERTQFGRPIAAFQAVQQLAATIASEASLVLSATDRAVQTVLEADEWQHPHVVFDVAVAKSTASAAASVVTRGAHQIVGAIGTTAEHPLHTVTLPALAWAAEFGTASHWNSRIARLTASASRAAAPWELICRVV
jgi:acyl-CoA dehydrogenase